MWRKTHDKVAENHPPHEGTLLTAADKGSETVTSDRVHESPLPDGDPEVSLFDDDLQGFLEEDYERMRLDEISNLDEMYENFLPGEEEEAFAAEEDGEGFLEDPEGFAMEVDVRSTSNEMVGNIATDQLPERTIPSSPISQQGFCCPQSLKKDELREVILRLASGRMAGHDIITNDIIKLGIEHFSHISSISATPVWPFPTCQTKPNTPKLYY